MNVHQMLQAFLTVTIWAGLRINLRAMRIAKWKEWLVNGALALAGLGLLLRILWHVWQVFTG